MINLQPVKLSTFGNSVIIQFLDMKNVYLILALLCFTTVSIAQTVSKLHDPSSVCIDGASQTLGNLVFNTSDFTQGCEITDVDVTIWWAKTDGTCPTANGGGCSFHNETYFTVNGPSGSEELAIPGTWSGCASSATSVTTTFSTGGANPSGTPTSGTFDPNNGNLANYNGTNGLGTWTLTAGDLATTDPLLVGAYRVTIQTTPDVTNPAMNVPSNINVGTDNGQCGATVNYSVSSSDVCGASHALISGSGTSSGSFFGLGSTSVIWEATDTYNNQTSSSFTITVSDDENPSISCPGNQTVNAANGACSATVTYSTPTASDNCSVASLSRTAGPASGGTFNVGVNTVTYQATDPAGNSSSCSFTVTVNDNQNPSISCPGNISVNNDAGICGSVQTFSNANASDNCSIASVTQIAGLSSGSTFPVGSSTVTFRATDASGNTADCSFTVTVTDSEDPSISCPGNISVNNDAGQCGANVSWSVPTGTDNCPSPVTVQTAGGASGSFFAAESTTTITYEVTDGAGNTDDCSFTVSVDDAENPVITCPSNITVNNDAGQCSAVVGFSNATATDNCPGVTVAQTGGQVSNSQFGVNSSPNTVQFTATDAAGNTAVCSFTVTVNDAQDPTIVCPADIVVDTDAGQCDAVVNWTEPVGADNCPGQTTVRTAGPAPGVTLAAQSVTTVSYEVTDASANTANCSFTITVEDNTFPLITCPADQNITFQNCEYTLLDYEGIGSVTTSDNCSPLTIVQTPAVGTVITEETTIQVSSTDSSGNESICAFTITPLDNSIPTFDNCPATDQVAVNASCQFFIPDYSNLDVSDECNPTFTFTQSPPVGSPATTTTTVTVTVSDGTNTADCTFDVEPVDNTNPTIVCPADQTEPVDANCQLTLPDYTSLATTDDNCDASVDVTQSPTGLVSGDQTITLTATDDAGNAATCTFDVEVEDTTPPTLSCPASITRDFNANCAYVMQNHTALATSLADNCSGQLTVTQSPSAGTSIGASSSTVTLTVTDASGNSADCSITLNLEDNTAPAVVCPSNQTVSVDANCDISLADYTGLVSATDNCPDLGSVTVTQSPVSGTTFDLNSDPTVTVTMTASDGSNSSTCTFTVILEDEIAPTLACPNDITVTGNANCEFTAGNYTSLVDAEAGTSDNCDAALTYTQSPSQGSTVSGTTTITVTGTDDAGNSGTCTFQLIVEDNTVPTITCPAIQSEVADANCLITLSSYTFLATADDNCDQNLTITQSPASGTTHNGNVTVTLTATDDASNVATCTFVVQHLDETAPSITCPSNQTVSADANCQFAVADYTSGFATTSDNCDLSIDVTQSPTIGSAQSGVTTVTLTAADDDGNTSTCTFNVTPEDNTDPTITCPADQVVSSSIVGGNCIFLVPDLTGTATALDNCSTSPDVAQSPAVGTVISATTTVTLTVEDDNGNTENCTFDLILNDDAAPTITCPGDFTVDADANCLYEIQDYTLMAIASDNCAPEPDVTQGTSPAIGSTITVNVATTITLTATDDSSNTASCTFDITAVDVTGPTVTCPSSPQTISSNSNCLVFLTDFTTSASSVDNCDGAGLAISQSPVAGSAIGGTTVVTLSSTDNAGNIGTCTFSVELDDSTPPSIACPGDQTVATDATCGYSLADYTSFGTATDNCDLTVVITQSPSSGASVSGTTTVTLTATDDDGNSSNCTFDVIGEDESAPTLSNCPPDATVSVSPTCTYIVGSYSASVSDNCDGSPTLTQSPLAGSLIGGTTVVTISATDASGNVGTCSFTLTPEDTSPPTIFDCPSDITQDNDPAVCGAIVTYGTITSIDNCAGVIVPQLTGGLPSGSLFSVGDTTVTYVADDGNGNTTTCQFVVTVNDVEDPIIVCPSDITQNVDAGTCEAAVTYSLPTVSDNCTSPITPTLEVGLASGSDFPVGPTTVTYGAVDEYGNESDCSFTVTVIDDENPVITCPTDITVGNDPGLCSAVVTYSLPTVTDNCTNPIIPTLSLGLASGETFPLGTTVIRYQAEDAAGNTSLCSFNVTVNDTEAPVLTCPSDTSVNCDALVEFDDATATDNCASTVTVAQITPAVYPFGPTTVTFEGDDGNGNTATCSFVVTVIDTVAPEITTCPADQTESFDATCNLSIPDYTGLAATTDNCDGSPVITQSPAAASVITGTTTVAITSTDFAGNESTCTFTVTDNSPPVVSCPSDQTVGSDINCQYTLLDYLPMVTTSDNCGASTLTQSPAVGTVIASQTTVTVTAEDDFGNTSTCDFDVILFDNINPSITCIGNQTAVFDANCEYQLPDFTGQAIAEDNCDLSPEVTQSPLPGSTITGTTTITLTATDDAGSSISCTFSVNPVDNIPPSITCPGSQVAQLDANCQFLLDDFTGLASAGDNCASIITVTQSPAAGSTLSLNTIVSLTVEDETGNTSSCAFVVVPEDNVPPTVVCPADLAVDFDVNCQYALLNYTGLGTPSDNCSTLFTTTQNPASGTIVTEATQIELTVNDGNGNSGTCTFQVIPEDNLPPTVTCAPDQNVMFDENCQFEIGDYSGFATASDNCANTITITQSPAAGVLVSGTSTVTLTAQDEEGNTASCDFLVIPDDQTAPTILCPDDQEVSFNTSCAYQLLDYTGMATAADNCGSVNVTQDVLVGMVVTSTVTVTLTATDDNGNAESCSFDVIPEDNTPPTVTCPGDQMVDFDQSCAFEMADYKPLLVTGDNCFGTIIDQSPEEGTVITAQTTVTMTVTDGNGNSVSCSFDVIPSDNQLPTLVCPGDQDVELDENCQYELGDLTGLATASDNCTPITAIDQFPPSGTVIVSSTEVELTVMDDSGNEVTCSFMVQPSDNTNPEVVSCPADVVLALNGNCQLQMPDFTGQMSATDNCDVALEYAQQPLAGSNISGVAVTTVQVAAIDDAGNAAICTVTVETTDQSAPTIDCPADQILALTANCEFVVPDYTALAAAEDACGSVTVTQSPAGGSVITSQLNATLIATDEDGNTASCTFFVDIVEYTVDVVGTDASCEGGNDGTASVTVAGGVAPYTQDWGGFDPNGLAAGFYTVTVTDANGCPVIGEVTIENGPTFEIEISPSGEVTICQGSSLSVDAGAGYADYDWSTGASVQTITVSNEGSYWVTVTNAEGCVSNTDTVSVSFYDLDTPDINVDADGMLICSNDTAASYQWYLNGDPIPNATDYYYCPLSSGNYYVSLVDANGCPAVSSTEEHTQDVDSPCATGIDEYGLSMEVYPNPSTGLYTLSYSMDHQATLQLSVIDLMGRPVSESVRLNTLSGIRTIDLSSEANGVYMLRIVIDGEHTIQQRLMLVE